MMYGVAALVVASEGELLRRLLWLEMAALVRSADDAVLAVGCAPARTQRAVQGRPRGRGGGGFSCCEGERSARAQPEVRRWKALSSPKPPGRTRPSSHGVGPRVMNHWDPFVFFPLENGPVARRIQCQTGLPTISRRSTAGERACSPSTGCPRRDASARTSRPGTSRRRSSTLRRTRSSWVSATRGSRAAGGWVPAARRRGAARAGKSAARAPAPPVPFPRSKSPPCTTKPLTMRCTCSPATGEGVCDSGQGA